MYLRTRCRWNVALERAGIRPYETDLADMIVQMGEDEPSHIIVPALHKNRLEIRDLFRETMDLPALTEEPTDLTGAARSYLRERFLRVKIGVSGANFAIAETGAVCVVESGGQWADVPDHAGGADQPDRDREGDPHITRTWKSSCSCCRGRRRASRMNPYNSLWTGVTRRAMGQKHFHAWILAGQRTDEAAGR